jgi:hypothetical protein
MAFCGVRVVSVLALGCVRGLYFPAVSLKGLVMFESIDHASWMLIKFVLTVGPFGLALLFAAWTAGAGYAGYIIGRNR